MKKLFTLLTMLVVAITSSWAADFVDSYGSLGTITGDYIANGISKITIGENAKANSGIQATSNGATLKFTVSTPDGFTIKTVRFKDSNVDESNITCDDNTGTLATSSHYTTLTASANKTSVEFTIPSSSDKAAKLTEFTITVSSSTTDDYELITPKSISSGVISYTSSLGDDKLVTAMAGVGGPSVGTSNIEFGNGKGFTISTSRAIKAIYCVWYQRAPINNSGWQGYSDASATAGNEIGTYSATTNEWTADDENTKFVAFKSSEGSTHKLSSIHIFYYDSSAPSISASGVNITKDATSEGEIAFTVVNPVEGGAVTAATEADWLTLGTVDNTNGKVPFTATANTSSSARVATVTLTYTYNTNETVTKDVTVTQAPEVKGTEIIRATITGSSTANITGSIGGTYDVNVQNTADADGGHKFGSNGHYVGVTLANGTFQAGDVINVHITQLAGGGTITIYDTKTATNVLQNTGEIGVVGDNKFVLNSSVDGRSTIYIVRPNDDNKWNAYVSYISVTRPNATVTLNNSGDSFTKGFSTYCAAQNFTVTGATAYAATLSGSKLIMTAIDGVVPANEGVVIAGEKGAKISIVYTDEAAATVSDNDLKGTTADAKTADLKGSAGKFLAFRTSTSTFTPYGGEYFPANKAYILLPAESVGASLEMVFDEATGINVVNASEAEAKAAPVKVIKNGQLYIGNYNVAGQLVK